MSAIPSRTNRSPLRMNKDVTALIPDFPFHYADFLQKALDNQGSPLGHVAPENYGKQVLIVGAGVAGLVAAYEAMRMGLHPVVVEASERIGGRLYSKVQGDPENPGDQVLCELGAMRFPVSGKALFHYFRKVGMSENSADFPNPGTAAAISTVVDYRGEKTYYEVDGNPDFPKPPEYTDLENQFFDKFLETYDFTAMEKAMTEGSISQQTIKKLWNAIVNPATGTSGDDVSFYAALLENSGWSKADIDLFGQIGFGTGGWNTDYPNSILELLRVLYTGLDADHQLMFDGSSSLPQRLWSKTPQELGDTMKHWPAETTVETLAREVFPDPFHQEVRHIERQRDGSFLVSITDTRNQKTQQRYFPSVIYTPHVRILDKLRYSGNPRSLPAMNSLLPIDTWEAIMYTHYMQSAKIFAATRRPFWNDPVAEGEQRKMSITLSDRLTRGTYLVDYSASKGDYKGSGIFLSYTWNDDALKFLGDRPAPLPQHVDLCTNLLDNLYPDIKLNEQYSTVDAFVEHNWEDQPLYLGAFKMNLPGQYEYQRRIFSQFMSDVGTDNPDRFILAGDDVSWTAGWAEGAVTTALNAVNKLAVCFGSGSLPGNPGPVESWDKLKPVERA
ncbi:tryptophan 2-monooxygenase [Pseudomonas chlororaphis]|uniref:flavin monoamine oxidase family protein n=1 Tax=Pseudomonas chlororaphis TaxID=587753 RepID=UPI00209D66A4|nr:NAD(P)/FAD-dependent oxidoreductase [Pseudomonas chlororaphis]MCP1479487.1 tryptophan 2-monooxygenase [Pseudomonas chlororaphis]MCP1594161.1 tryptophan 2-monooxygenase [Pseudomonas chlororaphis]